MRPAPPPVGHTGGVTQQPAPQPADAPEAAPRGPWSLNPGWRNDFRLQLAISGLSVFAVNASRPFVTYQALALGASEVEVGLIASAFSFVPAITAVVVGRLVDRGGEARYLALSMLIFTIGTAWAGVAGSLVALAVTQLLAGSGHILNLVSSQAMIANRGPREERDQRFGSYAITNSIGQLGGPVIAGILAGATAGVAAGAGVVAVGYELADGQRVFFVSALATGIAFACAFAIYVRHRRLPRFYQEMARPETEENILRAAVRVLRRPGMPAAMVVSIIVISVIDVLLAYLPVYGEYTGLAVAAVGFLLSIRAGASLVTRLFMVRTIQAIGRQRTLATSLFVAGLGMGLVPFTTDVPVLAFAMVALGLGLGMCQPMTIAWVAQISPRAERGTALGVRLTGNRASLLVVPALMGAIAGAAGVQAIFLVLSLALLAGAATAARTPFDDYMPTRRDPGADAAGDAAGDAASTPA